MSKKKVKFSVLNKLYEGLLQTAQVNQKGEVRIRKSELKKLIEDTFHEAAKKAASGEKIRFPVIGALIRKEVQARKAGKGKNPFTGEEIMIKARPATKKPRWSFPRSLKVTFSDKKNW